VSGWTNLTLPNKFAHPFGFRTRDGRVLERMLATIPKGVVLPDGRDVGGWSLSVFATPWALAQKRAGRPVSIGLRSDRPVELFRGRGPKRRTLRLDGPDGLRAALDAHRMARRAAAGAPETSARMAGRLDDAAPPFDGPASDEGLRLFSDLAFDTGFVSRMDSLAARFADDFVHGRYDPRAALDETRSLAAETAMLLETATGAGYGDGAVGCAAGLALSAATDVVNGRVDSLVDEGLADPRVAAANRRARTESGPPADEGMAGCLRMFSTAYGRTEETDVFGDGMPVADVMMDGLSAVARAM